MTPKKFRPTRSSSQTRTGVKAAAFAVGAALALTLSACGGSTANQEDTGASSSVATLSEESGASGAESDSSTSEKTSAPEESTTADEPVDETGATEVEKAPNAANPRTDDDNKYLKLLKDGGIDVEGDLADQLIGTGHEVCLAEKENKREFVTPAVGGQLVAQKKTKLSGEDAAKLIADSAKKVYC